MLVWWDLIDCLSTKQIIRRDSLSSGDVTGDHSRISGDSKLSQGNQTNNTISS